MIMMNAHESVDKVPMTTNRSAGPRLGSVPGEIAIPLPSCGGSGAGRGHGGSAPSTRNFMKGATPGTRDTGFGPVEF
jgi:hypothetical protein